MMTPEERYKLVKCAVCEYPLSEHIGYKSCTVSTQNPAVENPWDLAVFSWAWAGDGKDRQA